MRPCRLLILAALLPEAQSLAKAFRLPGTFPLIYSPDISIALVGPRAARLNAVVGDIEPRAVLLAGLGGGLFPTLKVGDVVVSEDDKRIVSSDELAATVTQKAALYAETGAYAVDMESKVVRAFARQRGVPCTVIRAISDTAQEALDPAVMTLVDADGYPRIGRAMGLLLKHPRKLGMLLRLQRASKVALAKMSAATVEFVAAQRQAVGTPGRG